MRKVAVWPGLRHRMHENPTVKYNSFHVEHNSWCVERISGCVEAVSYFVEHNTFFVGHNSGCVDSISGCVERISCFVGHKWGLEKCKFGSFAADWKSLYREWYFGS